MARPRRVGGCLLCFWFFTVCTAVLVDAFSVRCQRALPHVHTQPNKLPICATNVQDPHRTNVAKLEATTNEDAEASCCHGLGRQPLRWNRNGDPPYLHNVSALILATAVLLCPLQAANAGFGPSSGATTSRTPGLSAVNIENVSAKKLSQLIDSTIDENRLLDLQAQLDALIEGLLSSSPPNDAQLQPPPQQRQPPIRRTIPERTTEPEESQEAQQQEEKAKEEPPVLFLENIRRFVRFSVEDVSDEVDAETRRLQIAERSREQVRNRERLLEKLEAQPWWFNYLAAFCGSVASTLVMHPVDTIKTRLQVVGSSSETLVGDDDTDKRRKQKRNRERDDPHENDKAPEGVFTNLYQGLTGNIWKEGPPSALYLGVYESVKATLLRADGKLAAIWASLYGLLTGSTAGSTSAAATVLLNNPTYLLSIYLVAGAAGELLGSIVRAPAEAVKSLVQTQQEATALKALERILGNTNGRENVYRAWSASIWRDVPFGAIQLAVFELTKAYILNNPNIDFDSSTLLSEAIIGAFAGGCGAFVTTPFDVITTRIITQHASTASADNNNTTGNIDHTFEPLGVFGMGKLVYEEGGVEAFFVGWKARVLYWAPAISLFLTCYCSVRQLGVKLDLFGV